MSRWILAALLAACGAPRGAERAAALPDIEEPSAAMFDPIAELGRAFPDIVQERPIGVGILQGSGSPDRYNRYLVLAEGDRLVITNEVGDTMTFEGWAQRSTAQRESTFRREPPSAIGEQIDSVLLFMREQSAGDAPSGTAASDEERFAHRGPTVVLAILAHYARALGEPDLARLAEGGIAELRFRGELAGAIVIDAIDEYVEGGSEHALRARMTLARSYVTTGDVPAYVDALIARLDRAAASPGEGPFSAPVIAAIIESEETANRLRSLAGREGELGLAAVLDDARPVRVAESVAGEPFPRLKTLGEVAFPMLQQVLRRRFPGVAEARAYVEAIHGGQEYEIRLDEWLHGDPGRRTEALPRMLVVDRARALGDLEAELARREALGSTPPVELERLVLELATATIPELAPRLAGIAQSTPLSPPTTAAVVLALARGVGPEEARAFAAAAIALDRSPPQRPSLYPDPSEPTFASLLLGQAYRFRTTEGGTLAIDAVGAAVSEVLPTMSRAQRLGTLAEMVDLRVLESDAGRAWQTSVDEAFADERLLRATTPACPTVADEIARILSAGLPSGSRGFDCNVAPTARADARALVENSVRQRMGRPAQRARRAPRAATSASTLTVAHVEGSATLARSLPRLVGRDLDGAAVQRAIDAARARAAQGSLVLFFETDDPAGIQLHARFTALPASQRPSRTQIRTLGVGTSPDIETAIARWRSQIANVQRTGARPMRATITYEWAPP